MDKRKSDDLMIKNNALMLAKLRYQRRTIYRSMADYRADIRATQMHYLQGAISEGHKTYRIATSRRWLDHYRAMLVNTSRGIAALSR